MKEQGVIHLEAIQLKGSFFWYGLHVAAGSFIDRKSERQYSYSRKALLMHIRPKERHKLMK
ncbi:hypothetical protein [Bacillus sp. 2205SS5-2]|uniref:hypothetical protein n=1 Tax=Bacillus sp. 2205SS5-2 TaxID=3109031 RepID=UPI00300512AB